MATTAKAKAPKAELKKESSKSTSTSVTVRKTSTAVVDAKAMTEALKKQAAAMAERTLPPGGNKIQVGQDKKFKLPDGSKVDSLELCIVDFVATHAFYEGSYDPKNVVPPGCYAVGLNPRDMEPVDESPNRQAPNCQVCPMNEFGSAGDGKACKNGRLLAVLPPNDAGDDVDAEADMLTMGVSPTALKGFDGFVQSVARTFGTPPVGVLTSVSFDEGTEYPRLVFSNPRPIPSIGAAFARQEEAKELLMVKPDFSQWVDPNKKGKTQGRGAAPAARGARR